LAALPETVGGLETRDTIPMEREPANCALHPRLFDLEFAA